MVAILYPTKTKTTMSVVFSSSITSFNNMSLFIEDKRLNGTKIKDKEILAPYSTNPYSNNKL